MAALLMKEELKCVLMKHGEPFAQMVGVALMVM